MVIVEGLIVMAAGACGRVVWMTPSALDGTFLHGPFKPDSHRLGEVIERPNVAVYSDP
jgi:hypothetical protein